MGDFAWPIAVVIIVIVFLFLFKRQIGGFIARTKKVSRSGIEAEGHSQASVTAARSSAAEKLLRESDSPLIAEQEKTLSTQFDELGLGTDEDRVRYLLRQCTLLKILREFESIYYLIYGSQIIALQHLNGRNNVTLDDLEPIYDFAAAAYPVMYENSSYERWFGFLTSCSLVLKERDNVGITVRGREFLRYLIAAGLDTQKMG